MNDTPNLAHEWATRRLLVYSAGLLSEPDTVRLEAHQAGCPECRARLDSVRAGSPADVGHLPASLIAHWSRAPRLLSGVERELVASHLASCDACREALAFAGHEPVLAAAPADAPARRAGKPGSRLAWGWAVGLAGAAAAAWLLVSQPNLRGGDPRTSATMGTIPDGLLHAVVIEAVAAPLAAGAVLLPETSADGGSDESPIRVREVPAGAGVVLVLPDSLVPASAADSARLATVTLFHEGRESGTLQGRWSMLGRALRIRPAAPLPPGRYDLRITLAGPAPGEPPRIWFHTIDVGVPPTGH